MPDIVTSINSMQKYFHRVPTIENMGLCQALDSIVACRVCRGQRMVAIKSPVTLTYTFKKCMYCNGSGTMSNRIGCFERR